MSEKMRNLLVRTLSGAVLTIVVVGAVLLSQWSFIALLLVILIGGMWEFYRLARREDTVPLPWLGLAGGVALLAASTLLVFTWTDSSLLVCLLLFLFFMLLIPMMFVCELFLKRQRPAADIGVTLAGIFYVALPLSMFLLLPIQIDGSAWNPWVILFYIFIIWTNDICAYLVGMTLGRHRLYPRISPNKSWEGFFGGIVGAIGMGLLAAWIMEADYLLWGVLAAIAAMSGVLGDLIESMFKRAAGVKDSGNILPGHGGWLDRFDALIFSVPFVFVFLILLQIL
ncbi:MAG TPA: phosphatidate cytidylyltransferase [Candidatus Alistipes avicola]|uniref:Phosphatidate cytidylyltransferase n=1 Tax=Candidatus Alistipes avicola TaxID=2838432 RepID=A0A9D2L4Y7_9BACT|nr:phosphatidate cytidylyltransferase [uncultured Alistipes sp.]HJA99385.1 phosphatidate cytidylyltransferase [Candidatus Alistipes avicola]